MSVTDILTIFRPATATPAEDSTRFPAILIVVIAINVIASVYLMLSGIDLSAFSAM
jgi:hypothetical protein